MTRKATADAIKASINKGIGRFDAAKDAKTCVAAIDALKAHAMNTTEREETRGANITQVGLFLIQELDKAAELEVAAALSGALVEIMCDPSNTYANETNITSTVNRMVEIAGAKDTGETIKKKLSNDLALIAKNSVVGNKTGYKLADPIVSTLLTTSPMQANDVIETLSTRTSVETVFMPQTLGTWLRNMTPKADESGLALAPIESPTFSAEAARTVTLLATNSKFMFAPELESDVDDVYLAFVDCAEDKLGRIRQVTYALPILSTRCKASAMALVA